MVKKGVILDNGKTAQSSMALYWKKGRQMAKKPKKVYQPTEQQAQDQRAESGFQNWKQYREKGITKQLTKNKQKAIKQNNQSKIQQEESEEIQQVKNKEPSEIKIPGFASKQNLQRKMQIEQSISRQKVDQSSNTLKIPNTMDTLSQEDIAKILRQKRLRKQSEKKKKEKQTVKIQADFLLEGMVQKDQIQEKPVTEEKVQEQVVEVNFFRSNILNQLTKGNTSIIAPTVPTVSAVSAVSAISNSSEAIQLKQKQTKIKQIPEQSIKNKKIGLSFKPRALQHQHNKNSL